jgi:hypothetical protein
MIAPTIVAPQLRDFDALCSLLAMIVRLDPDGRLPESAWSAAAAWED